MCVEAGIPGLPDRVCPQILEGQGFQALFFPMIFQMVGALLIAGLKPKAPTAEDLPFLHVAVVLVIAC